MRSGLTALGIFMGVAAVNATLNISSINNAADSREVGRSAIVLIFLFMFIRKISLQG